MNIWLKITSGVAIALLATLTITTAVSTTASAQDVVECGCDSGSCQSCFSGRLLRNRAARSTTCCPNCSAEVCELEAKESKEKKTCYKVEEKTICIPAVWLPWQKCAPTCSKTRKINVLKKHSFECPKCEYKWSVVKPQVIETQPVGSTEPLNRNPWNEYSQSPSIAPRQTTPPVIRTSAPKPSEFTPSGYFDVLNGNDY